ncbi:MAG: hypothetical protein APR62_07120 [Smithella sp. SDB]|nr:MAG: hypothetical protein APR62_07120 [Smithella sp. SDB]
MVNSTLQSSKIFSSIYDPDCVFVARSSQNASHWLPPNRILLDIMTAGMMTVLGDMPIICAASASSTDALCLLRDAGFWLPREIHSYVNADDFMMILKKFRTAGMKVVAQHVYPLSEIPQECCWIDPSILSFLNNKANLGKLVPVGNIPARDIILIDQIVNGDKKWNLPVVIKAATDESTGGGVDVRICFKNNDIKNAASYFSDCRFVICEEYLNIQQNLCLHYCVTADGTIDYLGFAEQVSDDNGAYCGNWLEEGTRCPIKAVEVGLSIVRAAYERGYYGIVGIDMAVYDGNPCKVFDLNFRGNGSTPAILYSESVHRYHRQPVIRLRRLKGKGNYQNMLDSVYRAMAKGILLPLSSCDPEKMGYIDEHPLLIGMILGETRQHVLENEHELISMGLAI